MGNFLRRFLAFIVGMVFGFVALGATIVTVGYTVYKNASLNDLGVTEEQVNLGGLNDATIEELVSLIMTASKDPTSYTFEELEKSYGFDVNGMLESMGVDVTAVHPDDINAIRKLSPFSLLGGNEDPLKSLSLGVIFAFIPPVDGVYPVFSAGARNKLRSYTLADIMVSEGAEEDAMTSIIYTLPIGSILSGVYTETYNEKTATYSYATEDGGILDAFGSLSLNTFTSIGEDFGKELNEGSLVDLGTTSLGSLFGLEDDGSALSSVLVDTTFGDLFVKDGDTYVFDFMVLLSGLKVGSLMGMRYCDENCSIDHVHKEGWYDADSNLVTSEDIAGEIMINLYDVSVEDLTNGTFDVTNIMGGIYFGKAFGLSITNKDGYCLVDCSEDHTHEYYWVFSDGEYAGAMNNALGNISISQVLEGELDLQEALGEVKLGEFMNMRYCNGSQCSINHTHKAGWYDGDDNLINGNNISDEIMLALYDVTIDELMSGEFDIATVTDGIYLGKALGYKIGNDAGYCQEDCNADHTHKYYWVNEEGKFVGEMDNALSNIALKDVMEGGLDINETLGGVKVGYVMGMNYCDGTACLIEKAGHVHAEGWYDGDGNAVSSEVVGDEIMLSLYDLTFTELTNGDFDIANLMDGIYFGKALGFKVENKVGYCQEDCNTNHAHKFYWVDEDGKFVGEMNNALSNIALKDAMNGSVDINGALTDVKLGDIMGNEYKDGKWYDANGAIITDEKIGDAIMLKLFDKSYGEITNDGIDFSTLTDGIYFGKALGYKIGDKAGYCQEDCGVDHTHKYYWVNESNEFVGEMDNALSNISFADIMNGSVSVDNILDDVKLGDLMGNEYKNGKWYDADGVLIEYANLSGGDKIVYKMYDKTMSSITNDGLDLNSLTEGMYVGEIMSYKGSVGNWKKPSGSSYVDATAMETVIADIKMPDLLSGKVDFTEKVNDLELGDVMNVGSSNVLKCLEHTKIKNMSTAIDELYIGDIMGYQKCTNNSTCPLGSAHAHDGKWYDGNTLVTGVYSTLSRYTIGDLSSGSVEIGSDLTIGELVETNDCTILNLLKDETLDTMSSATNKLLLGEVMGYEKVNKTGYCAVDCLESHSHKYYWEKGGSQIEGLNSKLANYTIDDVSKGKLGGSEFVNSLTMGDIFEDSQLTTGAFSLMYIGNVGGKSYDSISKVPVNEISNRTVKGVESATYTKLENAGISLLDDDTENSVTLFYTTTYQGGDIPAGQSWKDVKTLPDVISDIINTFMNVSH